MSAVVVGYDGFVEILSPKVRSVSVCAMGLRTFRAFLSKLTN